MILIPSGGPLFAGEGDVVGAQSKMEMGKDSLIPIF